MVYCKKHLLQVQMFLRCCFTGTLLSILFSFSALASGPILIKNGVAQLFIDNYLIESQENLERTLYQPIKDFGGDQPIIALENEFGKYAATLEANGTIVYDPRIKKYVMFALAFSPEAKSAFPREQYWKFFRRYRFTSDDGMNWIKGDDGHPQCVFPRSAKDLYDPKSGKSATNIDAFSCYYDMNDQEYPYKGWQHIANWGDDREGHYYQKSKDGIYWERGPIVVNGYGGKNDPSFRTIVQDGRTLAGPGDVTLFYYDKIENRFLGIFKFYSPTAVEYGNKLRSRAYAFFSHPLQEPFDTSRLDHLALLPPAARKNNDYPYDEYYGSTGWRYESMWLGGLKVWHSGGDYPWSAAGCAYLKLISSRDGLNWTKVPFANENGNPEIFIPNGAEGGNNAQNDGGYITEFSQGPLRIGDNLIFYYGCSSYGKNHPSSIRISGGGIFRARLRVDGFVSVTKGSLTTKPLSFTGNKLFLNSVGPITVEILDMTGKTLGFQRTKENSIHHEFQCEGKNLSQIASGNVVRLRFTVGRGGQLYSFTINKS